MTFSFDETPSDRLEEARIASASAWGLTPGPAGYRIARLRCAPGLDGWHAEGCYSEHAVALVLSGVFDYASEGWLCTAVPGAFVLANRQEAFSVHHLCTDGNQRLVVFFAAEMLESIAGELGLNVARFPVASAPPSQLTPIMQGFMLRIARASDDSDESAVAIAEIALRSVHGRPAGAGVSEADRRRVIEATRYINAHFARPCTLDALASCAGMSRFHFARRFRAVTGETAAQYVLNRRLSAAASELLATARPVSDIAFDAGFGDLSYFHARFKAAFGAAPGAWRRLRRV
jgi:AraC-like DNA-binding protein